mmetsp:Transcript_107325/g.207950  ORF Transcript_107325/g.207950 Transcript_107325/m.207950 type:complete len:207 (+) Transcript_107325:578-1198(+)
MCAADSSARWLCSREMCSSHSRTTTSRRERNSLTSLSYVIPIFCILATSSLTSAMHWESQVFFVANSCRVTAFCSILADSISNWLSQIESELAAAAACSWMLLTSLTQLPDGASVLLLAVRGLKMVVAAPTSERSWSNDFCKSPTTFSTCDSCVLINSIEGGAPQRLRGTTAPLLGGSKSTRAPATFVRDNRKGRKPVAVFESRPQ